MKFLHIVRLLLLVTCVVKRAESRVLYASSDESSAASAASSHRARRELLESETKPVFVLRTRNHGILMKFNERKDALCVLVPCVVYALPPISSNVSAAAAAAVEEEEYARLRIAPGKEIHRKLGNHGKNHHKNVQEADAVMHDMTRRALGRSLVRNGDGTVPTTNVNLLFAVDAEEEISPRRKHACEAEYPIRCVIVPKNQKNRVLYEQFGIVAKRNVLIRVREGKVQKITAS